MTFTQLNVTPQQLAQAIKAEGPLIDIKCEQRDHDEDRYNNEGAEYIFYFEGKEYMLRYNVAVSQEIKSYGGSWTTPPEHEIVSQEEFLQVLELWQEGDQVEVSYSELEVFDLALYDKLDIT